jgi:hypothetical protein
MISFSGFIDYLNETMLFEMAYERKKAKEIVTSLSPEMFSHLIKMHVFDSPTSIHHWQAELNAWLLKINRIHIKPKSIKPDSKDLYTWFVYDSSPHYTAEYIKNEIRIMKRQEYKSLKMKPYEEDELLHITLDIIKRVMNDISSNDFETIEDYM